MRDDATAQSTHDVKQMIEQRARYRAQLFLGAKPVEEPAGGQIAEAATSGNTFYEEAG
jgi:hypothetical protein